MVRGEAILLQSIDHERGDLAVIFNYQHAHKSSGQEYNMDLRAKTSLKAFTLLTRATGERSHRLKSMSCHGQ
jgi:hypothetical protein